MDLTNAVGLDWVWVLWSGCVSCPITSSLSLVPATLFSLFCSDNTGPQRKDQMTMLHPKGLDKREVYVYYVLCVSYAKENMFVCPT
jgi:hypothetical protein